MELANVTDFLVYCAKSGCYVLKCVTVGILLANVDSEALYKWAKSRTLEHALKRWSLADMKANPSEDPGRVSSFKKRITGTYKGLYELSGREEGTDLGYSERIQERTKEHDKRKATGNSSLYRAARDSKRNEWLVVTQVSEETICDQPSELMESASPSVLKSLLDLGTRALTEVVCRMDEMIFMHYPISQRSTLPSDRPHPLRLLVACRRIHSL
ncbi:unnamed protein product [Sympodiomycopsis kandeliae]